MTFLIDGHNLIPHLPGMSLDQLDDEQALIDLLAGFSASRKCRLEVFFDRAQLDRQQDYQRNRVHVHFVPQPITADGAIIARLLGIGRAARNYTVVTSDRKVQSQARQLGASVLSSENFVRQLQGNRSQANNEQSEPSGGMGENEIAEWLELFSKGKNKGKKI